MNPTRGHCSNSWSVNDREEGLTERIERDESARSRRRTQPLTERGGAPAGDAGRGASSATCQSSEEWRTSVPAARCRPTLRRSFAILAAGCGG